jgi:precorrin-6B methylase 1
MAIYTLQAPDGKTYKIEGPAGATAEQLGAFITSQSSKAAPYDPTEGMSTTEKVLAGIGKAMTDTARGAGQMVGLVSRDDVAESRRLDKPLMNTTGGTVGNVIGNVAINAPLAFVPGANTIAGGAAIGAASGLMQPSISSAETAQNMALGGIAGGAVPAAIRGFQIAKSAIDPFSESGRNLIIGRALNRAAGNQSAEAAQALISTQSAVPGVQYTAAEAANNPGIAALQRTATAIDPIAMNQAAARQAVNNTARVDMLEGIAGTHGARSKAVTARQDVAGDLYDKARSAPIDPAALTPEAQSNIASFMQRIPDSMIERAKKLAKMSGINMDNETSTQGMHWVKKALDGEINVAMRSGDSDMARAYTILKKDLLNEMDQINPSYASAREAFSKMSKPITEMDVAQLIADKSVQKLTGNLQPNAFARALSDQTAQQASGMANATLQGAMTPQKMAALEAIKQDLIRQNFAQTAGRGVGSDTVQKLAMSNMLDQSGLPTFVRNFGPSGVAGNILQRGGQIAYADANKKMSEKLAQSLLDAQLTAELMQGAVPGLLSGRLLEAGRRSGVALGASMPGLLGKPE